MSLAYEIFKEGKYNKWTWFEIAIEPPSIIHILINIKNWGVAMGHLTTDKKAFICSLPCADSPVFVTIPVRNITHWAAVPDLKKEDSNLEE